MIGVILFSSLLNYPNMQHSVNVDGRRAQEYIFNQEHWMAWFYRFTDTEAVSEIEVSEDGHERTAKQAPLDLMTRAVSYRNKLILEKK